MRYFSMLAISVLIFAALPSPAQAPSGAVYSVEIDKDSVFRVSREDETGQGALFVTIQFKIHRQTPAGEDNALPAEGAEEYIVVKENDRIVDKRKLTQLKTQALTTVLVLDHSGSMRMRATETDTSSKIDALKRAASQFVELMPPRAKTTLLPFSSTLGVPGPFSANKEELKAHLQALKPDGGTLLYDATFAGIETLAAARPEGSKFVVVLTDGKDEQPGSRHSPAEVIRRAREAGVKLYMLGLGRKREINEKVMREIAEQTGGKYYHAENQQKLFELFDGLATQLQTNYSVTFRSHNPSHDGTARGIDISIVRDDGQTISNVAQTDMAVHGVVVAQRDSAVYLWLLAVLCGFLMVPPGLRKVYRAFGGT